MLDRADRPVEDVIRFFSEWGIESGFLVPTETGLAKSIMDAHGQLRSFLQRSGAHDFDSQLRGQASKILIKAWLLGIDAQAESAISLYRPETKEGDPRIWISKLPSYARAGNLLAILVLRNELYVVNASAPGLLESGRDPRSPLGRVLNAISNERDEPVAELLGKIRAVAAKGFVPSLRQGPTGVGMTLETMLGIPANSRRSPDYRGIEIKASRGNPRRAPSSRVTLFSKVPDWKSSTIQTPVGLLQRHGYDRAGRRQLYCSMKNVPNTLGLFLSVKGPDLHAMHCSTESEEKVVQWPTLGLRSALAEKHQQTFWVKASAKPGPHGEMFHYHSVLHTRAPMVANLDALLELGHVEVDFVLHLMGRGPGKAPRARDHGYLFKLDHRKLDMLFPPSVSYNLA